MLLFLTLCHTFALSHILLLVVAQDVLNCSLISTGLQSHIDWTNFAPTHTLGAEKDVAFEMIGDNFTQTMIQLDSVRGRKSKFVCINDNMQNPTPELENALRAFFEAFFPFQSKFELPPGQSNPTLYLDEYRALQARPGHFVEEALQGLFVAAQRGVDDVLYVARTTLMAQALDFATFLDGLERRERYDEIAVIRTVNGLRADAVRAPHVLQSQSRLRTGGSTLLAIATALGVVWMLLLRCCISQRARKGQCQGKSDIDDDDDDGEGEAAEGDNGQEGKPFASVDETASGRGAGKSKRRQRKKKA